MAEVVHDSTEYRGTFARFLPWRKVGGVAQHQYLQLENVEML